MNSLVVGGLIKRIYEDFDMNTFSNRLRLQKMVYLLQEEGGINLGYKFSWYVHGPYSTELTRDAFQIQNFTKIKEVGFEDNANEEKFKLFKNKIDCHKNDDFWLEISTSIHLLIKIYPTKSKTDIIKEIQERKPNLKNKTPEISEIWNEIKGWSK